MEKTWKNPKDWERIKELPLIFYFTEIHKEVINGEPRYYKLDPDGVTITELNSPWSSQNSQ